MTRVDSTLSKRDFISRGVGAFAAVSVGLPGRAAQAAPTVADDKTANVKEYGAVGDGIADDTAAVLAAADAVWNSGSSSGGGTLYFPFGDYRLRQPIERYEFGNNTDVARAVRGDGDRLSRIIVDSPVGFLRWEKSNYGLFFSMSDIAVVAGSGQLPSYGVVLKQHHSGNRYYRHFSFRNVVLQSQDNNAYFNTGIQITGGGRAQLSNVMVSGRFVPGKRPASWVASTGIALIDHYGPVLQDCMVWGCLFQPRCI